jgi:pentatricopeptide repeat domain-containing protein 2
LGLDTFQLASEKTKVQVPNLDKFKAKMEEFVKDENSKNLIFTEDLKNMIHIATAEDSQLLIEMIKRFCSQSKEVRFGNFIFGPPVMRFFHTIKDSDTAFAIFKNDALADSGFFDQTISYQILLDLLYENGKYEQVLEAFDIIQSRQLQGARYPKYPIILVFASCYKLNTKESFEYAKKLWHNSVQAGHVPLRRSATFFATLALNQNEAYVALEVLTNLKGQNYVTVRGLKALSLAHMKRFEDVLPVLRSILEAGNPMMNKQTIPKDLLETLDGLFKKENKNKDLQMDFEKVSGFLHTHGHVASQTLDEIITNEITVIKNDPNQQQQQRGGGYSGRRLGNVRGSELDRPSRFTNRRPGLHELN